MKGKEGEIGAAAASHLWWLNYVSVVQFSLLWPNFLNEISCIPVTNDDLRGLLEFEISGVKDFSLGSFLSMPRGASWPMLNQSDEFYSLEEKEGKLIIFQQLPDENSVEDSCFFLKPE